MQRREFLHQSTFSIAGLLTAQVVFAKSNRQFPSQAALAVFCPEPYADHPAVAGAVRMLEESRRAFELLRKPDNLAKYPALLLPDVIRLTPEQTVLLEDYLDRGGFVLASHQSGLTPDGSAFASSRFGLQLVGKAAFSPDFLVVAQEPLSRSLPETDFLMYLRGTEVQSKGASVLAWTQSPFTSTGASSSHYCYPGITRYERVAYLMHPVFTQYAHTAPRWCKQLVLNTLDFLLEDTSMPAAVS